MTMHFGKGRSMGHLNRKTQGLSSAATVTAAWNPADKNGTWTLSASNLRAASTSSSGVTSVRGNTPRTTGKWYWEFVQNAGTPFVGLATLSQTLTTASTSANTAGWYQPTTNVGGWVNNAGGGFGSGTILALAAWGAIAVDLDAGKIWFRASSGWWNGDPATGASGYSIANLAGLAVYPYLNIGNSETADVTANFGASAFQYSVPTGFSAW